MIGGYIHQGFWGLGFGVWVWGLGFGGLGFGVSGVYPSVSGVWGLGVITMILLVNTLI